MLKKLLKLLTPGERKRLYLLLFVMIISAVVEVAGIASILPFLALIASPETIETNSILNWFYVTFDFTSTNRFLIFIGGAVLGILILSNVLVFLTQWGLAKFSWMRNYSISRRLMKQYIYQPYMFFLNQNTSNISKNILSEVNSVVSGVIVPLLKSISRGIVALFILIMLIVVEPLLALALFIVLGGAYVFTYRFVKKRLSIKGKIRYKTNAAKFKAINEAFGDIKQVKLKLYERFFLGRYAKAAEENAKVNATSQIIGTIPRYILEVIAFGGIIMVVIYLLARGQGFGEFLPIIGLYAFSTYRMLPSIQGIFEGMAKIRFSMEGLDFLNTEIENLQEIKVTKSAKSIKPMKFSNSIMLKNIVFSYADTSRSAIDGVDVNIKANTSVAFVGITGVGKTTIANIILGLLAPSSGDIYVDGQRLTEDNLKNWQRNLGYIPQDIYLQDDTVTHNITFGIPDDEIDMDAVIRSTRIANIHDFIESELPKKYETVVGERGVRLSGGQRQRLGIARALYHNPEVLVLDEATSALDGATEKEVFKAIENVAKTKTLVMIAHRLTTIQNCDVIYVMEKGKIVGSGTYEELLKSNKSFQKIAKVR
jgi:ATP-binding cassette, subfamily B, bacterial PglK